ncbi:hypothetical protein G6F58_013508 [Rhizopus delemar]|nr:hypothetical protein G6F58_013508 [Rhizopus delemar]
MVSQHYRHRDGRDQRGPPVLQEQVHHQHHQDDRLDQGDHHFLQRDGHERGGGEGHVGGVAMRPVLLQLLQPCIDGLGDGDGIGTGIELDAQRG